MTSIRLYRPADQEACLGLFESNAPRYFLREERSQFQAFLEGAPSLYWVLGEGEGLIACGGLALRGPEASLCWGMVQRERHRRGAGTALLVFRLAKAAHDLAARSVRLDTSQHSAGFFLPFGFLKTKVTPGHYGPGLDRWDLEMTVTDAVKTALEPVARGDAAPAALAAAARRLRGHAASPL